MALPKSEMSVESVAVVAVPYPAQGHLNGMLHMSLLLASRGLPVHYAAPGPHVRQARARVHGWGDDALRRIEFHELEVPAYATPPPDPAAPSPFPTHLIPMGEAFVAGARAPVATLLANVSARHRRVVVLYDRLSSFAAPEAARIPNGEAFCLQCVASSFDAAWTDAGQRLLRARGLDAPHPAACMPREFVEYIVGTQEDGQSPAFAGVVANTSRAIESEFIDLVAGDPQYRGKRVFAVGPMNPLLDVMTAPAAAGRSARHECLDWLDRQPPASVLYVSFGTTTSLPAEQIAELAAALRDSKQRFVWVLRDADRGVVHEEEEEAAEESRHARFLSEFTEETRGIGLVITGWAPQLQIQAHGATAAFMSHCGWNSTMESLSHGNPMLAWPMHSDQPLVAELVCKFLKAGILVRPWEQHGAVTPADAIREAIEKVMARDEGLALRERAKELMESIRASVAEGGSSRKDLDDFVAYIAR